MHSGRFEITSQNHGFAVSKESTEMNKEVEVTLIHLNDQTIAGIHLKNKPLFSVQYHPEASPGPNDSAYLFNQFLPMIENYKDKRSTTARTAGRATLY